MAVEFKSHFGHLVELRLKGVVMDKSIIVTLCLGVAKALWNILDSGKKVVCFNTIREDLDFKVAEEDAYFKLIVIVEDPQKDIERSCNAR